MKPHATSWAVLLWAVCSWSQASTGQVTLDPGDGSGPVTVLYPSASPPSPTRTAWYTTPLAKQGQPSPGNGRLVVISHGSGGHPWVHLDLAQRLVGAGYVVAFPQHQGDHAGDMRDAGPDSWTRRPGEVSRAIDLVLADGRWPDLDPHRVGLYGMSAGGHTALSLAGGEWSPARFAQHCKTHLSEDVASCVGLSTRLTGGWADGLKQTVAQWVIDWKFSHDKRLRRDHDERLAAIVAVVPSAADFDPDTLAQPKVPLGLVNALQDRWLAPRFQGLRIAAACAPCEQLGPLAQGGHGAGLSPLPPGLSGLLGELLNDPPDFDRPASEAALATQVLAFFDRHLVPAPSSQGLEASR